MKSVLKKAAALIISLALIMSMLTVISVSADYFPYNCKEFNLVGVNDVNIEEEGAVVNFSIVPKYSVSYTFYTDQSEYDTAFNLYNSNYECMYGDFDVSEEDKNFSVTVSLYAGETYYLETYVNDSVSKATYNIYSKAENVTQSFDVLSSNGVYSIFPHEYISLYTDNVYPEHANYIGYTWSSSNENVATVDEYGNVYGVAEGTTVITATEAFGAQTSVTIEVKGYKNLPLNDYVTVDINAEGQKEAYSFTPEIDGWYVFSSETQSEVFIELLNLEYNSGENFNLSSESDSYKAYLTGGSTYVLTTYLVNSQIGSYTVKYNVAAESISIGCSDIEISEDGILRTTVGGTANLFAKVYPENAEAEEITWSSNNESVATVAGDGVVAFHGTGWVTIEAISASGYYAYISCDVGYPVIDINLGDTVNVEFDGICTQRQIKFSPTVSGLYELTSLEPLYFNVGINIYDEEQNLLYNIDGNGFGNYLKAGYYFEAGKAYYFHIHTQENTSFSMTLREAEYLQDFEISTANSTICVGTRNSVEINGAVYEKFTFEIDDDTVARLENNGNSNSSIIIIGLKAGIVTLTATSQTGIQKTLTVTVVEPLVLEEDNEVQLELDISMGADFVNYKFIPSETAKYEFYFNNIVGDSYIIAELKSESGDLTSADRTANEDVFSFQEYLEAGKTYFLYVYSSMPTQMTVGFKKTVTLEGIVINDGAESVGGKVGENLTVRFNTLPSHADYGNPEWQISDSNVANIMYSSRNNVTLRLQNTGECELTVRAGDYTDTITVIVEDIPELSLDTPVGVVISGYDDVANFKFIPETDGEYVFYSTGDSDTYAGLEQNGELAHDNDSGEDNNFKISYYLCAGQTYYLNCYGFMTENANFDVAVSKAVAVQSITLSENEISLRQGESKYIYATLGPVECKNESVCWNSRNSAVAILQNSTNNFVEIVAVSGGTAVISATTESGVTATVTVNVKGSNEFVIGSANTVEITEMWIGEKFILNIEEAGVYEFYSQNINMGSCYMGIRQGDEEYQYFYSDSSFNFRFQKTLEAGTYQIDTGYNDGCIGSFDVYAQKTVTPETVIINNGAESIDVYVGDSQKLNLTLTPEFSNEMLIGWSSSDESVVTVQNGIINVLSQGTATVTATLPNGNSDSIIINGIASNSLTVGAPQTVELGAMGEPVRYRINIEQSGWYLFNISSANHIGISLYDMYMNSMGDFSYGMRLSSYFEAGTYYVDIFNCTEQSGTADCFITKAPNITSLEIKNYPDNMQHEIGTEFDYTGLVVNATFENGQTADWTWGTGALLGGCYSVGVWEEPDENGNYGCTVIYAGGQRLTFTLEIVESNVVGFEVYSGSIGPFYENVDTRECQDHYHYNYHRYISNIKFIIRYRDGSYKIASCYENVDGYTITDGGDHCDELWTVGGDNYIYFCYRNLVTKFKVDLLENPVESIVVNTAPETEIIFGDGEYGWMGGDGYYLKWEDLSWLTFTVNYKDNTSKIFTINDAVFEYGPYLWDGQQGYAESGVITGAGTYTGYFKYMGAIAEFKFTVKASPVTSVEILKGPDVTAVKYGYYPDFKGMQLKVTYADNTEKIITVNSDNLVYELNFNVGLYYYIKDGDNTIEIVQWQDENGSVFYQLRYYDVIVEYKGFEFLENESAEITVNNINITGDKLVVTVDGITYSFDDVEFITDSNDDINNVIGYKETADGLMMYTLSTYLDDNGYVTGFEGNALGMYFGFEILSGDFNGDGAIDVRDLVAAKNASADMAEPENKFNADMNFDGKFDASDLPLYIRRLLNMCA